VRVVEQLIGQGKMPDRLKIGAGGRTMRMNKLFLLFLSASVFSCVYSSPVVAGAGEETAPATLDDAVNAAQNLLDTHRAARPSSAGAVHDDTPINIPETIPAETLSSVTDFEALYVHGAEVAKIWGPNDAGYRLMSVKLYSMRDPGSGSLINKIGIVDITPGDISTPTLPQFFSVMSNKTNYFRMVPGGREYALAMPGDGTIRLSRIDARRGQGGALETSLRELTTLRNDLIMQGSQVSVDGVPYYVVGQGGQFGSVLFFPKNALDRDRGIDAHPDLMANVTQVLSDGSTVPVRGHPSLGSTWGHSYHLEMGDDGLWHVAPGPGDTGN
jgi:hypothetical protein